MKILKALLLLLLVISTTALEPVGERTRLYTVPDPACPGGLKGRIVQPELPIEQILAIPAANPEYVYMGEVSGAKRDSFQFKGLPVGKYDMVVIYDNSFYEGFQLIHGKNTLTGEDLKKIDAMIQKSEPFFTKKIIHRLEGETGTGNQARCICTFVREKGSELLLERYNGAAKRDDFRRTFKLVTLKDVGPGWQVVRARDLYPVWMDPKHQLPAHHFSAQLTEIRVADELKDVGDLDLNR